MLALACVLVPLLLLGCPPPGTAVGRSLGFQGAVKDQTYTTGWPIAPLILPSARGGTGPLSYTLRPPIPGLTFEARERTLRGTPAAAGRHEMTYTVSDGQEAHRPCLFHDHHRAGLA